MRLSEILFEINKSNKIIIELSNIVIDFDDEFNQLSAGIQLYMTLKMPSNNNSFALKLQNDINSLKNDIEKFTNTILLDFETDMDLNQRADKVKIRLNEIFKLMKIAGISNQ